jgi:hypothetical protein
VSCYKSFIVIFSSSFLLLSLTFFLPLKKLTILKPNNRKDLKIQSSSAPGFAANIKNKILPTEAPVHVREKIAL